MRPINNPLELTEFHSDVRRHYSRFIDRDSNALVAGLLDSFEAAFKVKKRVGLQRFPARKEAEFLYMLGKGINFLLSDDSMFPKNRRETSLNMALESLINKVIKNPELLKTSYLSKIQISSNLPLLSWKNKNVENDHFTNALISILFAVRNRHHFQEKSELTEGIETLPLPLVFFFKKARLRNTKRELINFTQLAVFLTQYCFDVDRNAFLLELLNHPNVIVHIPDSSESISLDNLKAALTALKKNKATWPKQGKN